MQIRQSFVNSLPERSSGPVERFAPTVLSVRSKDLLPDPLRLALMGDLPPSFIIDPLRPS